MSKVSIISVPLLLDSNQTMTSGYTSPAQRIANTLGFAIEMAFTGSPSGNAHLQACVSGGNWNDMDSTTVAISGAGSCGWEVDVSYNLYFRVVYVGSGTATLTTLWTNVKQ